MIILTTFRSIWDHFILLSISPCYIVEIYFLSVLNICLLISCILQLDSEDKGMYQMILMIRYIFSPGYISEIFWKHNNIGM